MSSEEVLKVEAFSHHIRSKICQTRNKYRRGRRETSVKVFTISEESKYLLIHNVPDIKTCVKQELFQLCQRFGPIEKLVLTDYPNCEDFTKVYLVKYKKFVNAVLAKKSLDDKNFLGSILHVCYAPEFETIEETKEKLNQRKRYVTQKLAQFNQNEGFSNSSQHQSCRSDANLLDINQMRSQSNTSLSNECNLLANTSHHMESQPVVESVTKDQIIDSKETSKRKCSQTDAYSDMRLNVMSKKPKLSSITPKIRWRNK